MLVVSFRTHFFFSDCTHIKFMQWWNSDGFSFSGELELEQVAEYFTHLFQPANIRDINSFHLT